MTFRVILILSIFFGSQLVSSSRRGIRICTNNETILIEATTRPSEKAIECQCEAYPALEPATKDGYVYTPGVGSHKLYTDALNWNDARKACIADGANLAIINSQAEETLLVDMLKKAEKTIKYGLNNEQALLGAHDLYKEGEWVTIFGEPLADTGYQHWNPTYFGGQPDNLGGNQNCAAVISVQGGGMDDVFCHDKFAYFCEMPISC